MKTVITATGNRPESMFDLRFGRAGWFCLFDEETGDYKFHENEFINLQHGAGMKVVEKIAELGAGKVISGDFGPRAKELLEKLNIQMVVLQDEGLTVKQLMDKIMK
jgi:predicted Fe-Mo cluster-binding NifX family protein